MIYDKKIFIFGGSGSLGNMIISQYLSHNRIVCYSRDECKHWKMGLKYNNNSNLSFCIGDVNDYKRIEKTLIREDPHIIILAAAMKHVDKCEYSINECFNTNLNGPKNVLDAVESVRVYLRSLESVCFISTDKACNPTNVYGLCKALGEKLFVERSRFIKDIKFVCIRYGNVLNSRGSIIPILHNKGRDPNVKEFTLNHIDMTRFIMTLDQSVDLIDYALMHGHSGDIIVPSKLISMRVKDLIEIFGDIYNKPIKISSIRPGEKINELLVNEMELHRVLETPDYIHITSPDTMLDNENQPENRDKYSSSLNPISKSDLHDYLKHYKLI